MAEIIVKAVDVTNVDAVKDRRGCYKRGMPVAVMPDGHVWGREEGLPKFVIIKIPGIPVEKVEKYTEMQMDADNPEQVYRRRLWQIQWGELPLAARNTLRDTGQLIIKAGTYEGPYNYTWSQIKSYFLNHATGLREVLDP